MTITLWVVGYIGVSFIIGAAHTGSTLAYFFSAGWRYQRMAQNTVYVAIIWPLMLAGWFQRALNPEETVPVQLWRDAISERNALYGDYAQMKAKLEVLEDYMRTRGFGDDLDSIEKQLAKDSEHNLSYCERGRLAGWTKGIFWGVRTPEDGPSWTPDEPLT